MTDLTNVPDEMLAKQIAEIEGEIKKHNEQIVYLREELVKYWMEKANRELYQT